MLSEVPRKHIECSFLSLVLQISLLGRLHHRNLVNLLGYCIDKGSHMLIYQFMSNGSLANHLYSKLKVLASFIILCDEPSASICDEPCAGM
jgi:serine/threonine protein kinase